MKQRGPNVALFLGTRSHYRSRFAET